MRIISASPRTRILIRKMTKIWLFQRLLSKITLSSAMRSCSPMLGGILVCFSWIKMVMNLEDILLTASSPRPYGLIWVMISRKTSGSALGYWLCSGKLSFEMNQTLSFTPLVERFWNKRSSKLSNSWMSVLHIPKFTPPLQWDTSVSSSLNLLHERLNGFPLRSRMILWITFAEPLSIIISRMLLFHTTRICCST